MADNFEVAGRARDVQQQSCEGLFSRGLSSGVHPSSGLVKTAGGLSGVSLGAALVATGAAKDLADAEESEGGKLTIFQAFMVAFCIAFGGNVALIGFYVKVVGFYLFLVVLFVLTVAGALGENALHKTAIVTGATSFNEMSRSVPGCLAPLTSASLVAWYFVVQALYVQFLYTFINDQLLGTSFPADGGYEAAPLYLPIGVVIYFITIPPTFSGTVVRTLTTINLYITYIVLIMSVVKGLHLIYTEPAEDRPTEYDYWNTEGIVTASVLLAGSMFQCPVVPRLQYELKRELQERAAWMIPLMLGSIQAGIFVVVGSIAYWALGSRIDASGDVFRSYYTIAPDWMVFVLQGGIAMLMFLSTPLLGVPAKSELWSFVAPIDENGHRVMFENSPLQARLLINGLMVGFATLFPMLAGRAAMTTCLTLTAGTAANWMNLFLPCTVIIYTLILPAFRSGRSYVGNLVKVVLILTIGTACMVSSVGKIIDLFV